MLIISCFLLSTYFCSQILHINLSHKLAFSNFHNYRLASLRQMPHLFLNRDSNKCFTIYPNHTLQCSQHSREATQIHQPRRSLNKVRFCLVFASMTLLSPSPIAQPVSDYPLPTTNTSAAPSSQSTQTTIATASRRVSKACSACRCVFSSGS